MCFRFLFGEPANNKKSDKIRAQVFKTQWISPLIFNSEFPEIIAIISILLNLYRHSYAVNRRKFISQSFASAQVWQPLRYDQDPYVWATSLHSTTRPEEIILPIQQMLLAIRKLLSFCDRFESWDLFNSMVDSLIIGGGINGGGIMQRAGTFKGLLPTLPKC